MKKGGKRGTRRGYLGRVLGEGTHKLNKGFSIKCIYKRYKNNLPGGGRRYLEKVLREDT